MPFEQYPDAITALATNLYMGAVRDKLMKQGTIVIPVFEHLSPEVKEGWINLAHMCLADMQRGGFTVTTIDYSEVGA